MTTETKIARNRTALGKPMLSKKALSMYARMNTEKTVESLAKENAEEGRTYHINDGVIVAFE